MIVRCEQRETTEDDGKALRLRKRLEESFRLPDDADADQITVFFKHRTLEIHAARRQLVPRQLPIKHPTYLVNPAAEPC